MLDFKKYLIKHFAKIKVIHTIPGRLRLKVPKQVYVAEEFRQYDRYVVDGVKLLDGIEDIQFNYVLGTILLTYDTNKVYEEKVLKWINRVVEIIIKNISLIEEYGESNLNYVITTLEQQLKEDVRNF